MARGPVVGTAREPMRAAAHKRRLEQALSGVGGLCRGLDIIDVNKALVGMTDEERRTWARHARAYSRHLSQFARLLSQGAQDVGA